MKSLRRHSRGIAGFAATLFVAVWASMAVAPCLMAAEMLAGGDCPHCPDPPPPCHEPDGTGSCSYIEGYDFDGRSPAAPKVEVELVALPPLALAAVALPVVQQGPETYLVRAPPDPGGPRLHLRHCVLND
ncbi:hypothetical protein [Thioalkalivibrio sp. XN279]|uniref:hypothetical protein n=1 Tax=Thioalkalivibrio sp. XN279 TaxID=2714953 RepID=UPI0014095B65|nr:hypothetical protein [Thioalkalivibrio sp. XN279]NHA14981.1 hypothetical protein [Thioalkalivibrio sp. XN279]